MKPLFSKGQWVAVYTHDFIGALLEGEIDSYKSALLERPTKL